MNESQAGKYRLSDDPIIRFCAFYLLLYAGSLILGGIGVFEIVFGLMIMATRILVRFPDFQSYLRRFFGFKESQQIVITPHSRIYRLISTVIRWFVIGFYVLVSAILIRLGIQQLLENGFLDQNLIYILFFR